MISKLGLQVNPDNSNSPLIRSKTIFPWRLVLKKNCFSAWASTLNMGVCSDERLTLETSAKHHIPQATNKPYQPLLIKPIYFPLDLPRIFTVILTPLIRTVITRNPDNSQRYLLPFSFLCSYIARNLTTKHV